MISQHIQKCFNFIEFESQYIYTCVIQIKIAETYLKYFFILNIHENKYHQTLYKDIENYLNFPFISLE